jgi:bifunctional ADP-heptose synthase (sugar kinase/adenylyltransferase)
MLSDHLIDQILTTIPNKRIGVVGDLFLDRYLDIDAALTEPSIETGLDAYQVVRVRSYPGALGTVINNLAALGVGGIHPIAFYGDDGEGYELQQALAKLPAVQARRGLLVAPSRVTPTYTKPILVRTGEQPRELNRLDIKNRTPTSAAVEKILMQYLDALWGEIDALIVLDQVSEPNCGVVTERLRAHVSELARRDPSKFVLADSRENVFEFRDVCVKPNEQEAAGYPGGPEMFASENRRHVFLTLGERGISLINPNGGETYVPAYPVSGPTDIVGAGDSTSAGIACAIMAGATYEQAAAFGNLVASITIQQLGVTGTATPQQVRDRWQQVRGQSAGP